MSIIKIASFLKRSSHQTTEWNQRIILCHKQIPNPAWGRPAPCLAGERVASDDTPAPLKLRVRPRPLDIAWARHECMKLRLHWDTRRSLGWGGGNRGSFRSGAMHGRFTPEGGSHLDPFAAPERLSHRISRNILAPTHYVPTGTRLNGIGSADRPRDRPSRRGEPRIAQPA